MRDPVKRSTMAIRVSLALLATLTCSHARPVEAGSPASDAGAAAAAMRSFEPAANEVYTLGSGDEIFIDVNGRPELSGKNLIGPDGTITLPLAGSVPVAGLTRERAASAIFTALSTFYTNVAVTVRVEKYASNRILLLGHVSRPGVLYFDRTPMLMEVLTQGGAPGAANGSTQSLPNRCAIYRGKDQVLWMDLKTMLTGGMAGVDMRLRRDDIVYVPSDQDEYISILGEVQHPGAYKITPDLTLTEVFAMSGGLTETAAPNKIRFIRPGTGTTREISLNDILKPGSHFDIGLRKGDVLYVPRSGFAKVGYILQKISPVSTLLLFGTTLGK